MIFWTHHLNDLFIFYFFADMLAEPSNIQNYNNGVIEASPLLYHQHSISRSENLNVLPLSSSSYSQQYEENNNPTPAAQNFLSTFFRDHQYNPPLGHNLRPYFQAAEPFSTTRSPSRLNAHRSVESAPPPARANTFDQSILGSGDFGVLRGGTFYQDNDPTLFRSSESSNEFSYFNKNGHGRPQTAAYVQRYTYPEDQFANFRDFADINTPNDAAFSHFVVVYKNRNGTTVDSPATSQEKVKYEPRNILDQLRLLDEESERSTQAPKSKFKRKLKRTKLTKKYTKVEFPKSQDDDLDVPEAPLTQTDQIADPLLALS